MLTRTMLKALSGAGLAIAVAGTAPALAQTKITAGVAAVNEALAPVYAAEAKGYLAEEGIEIEMLNFKGGGATVQALVGGSIDACLCAADHVLRLAARGMPARIVAGLDDFHSYAVLTNGDAPYDSLESLKGKSIGITSPGSLTDNTVRYAIGEAGMDPDSDFTIIASGNGTARRGALMTGQIDAAMFITTDVVDMLQTDGEFKIVEDFRELAYPSFTFFVLESWAEDHPELMKGISKALAKAIGDLQDDPAFAEEIIAQMYPNFSEALVKGVAESMVSRMPTDGIVTEAAFENLNDILTTMDDTLSPVSLGDVFDPSMLKDSPSN